MKKLPVVALQVVTGDIQAAYDYFEARTVGLSEVFLERYFGITDKTALNSEIFPIKFDDYRRALVPRTHLATYYFIETQRAVIVAVIDARRRPGLIRNLVRLRR